MRIKNKDYLTIHQMAACLLRPAVSDRPYTDTRSRLAYPGGITADLLDFSIAGHHCATRWGCFIKSSSFALSSLAISGSTQPLNFHIAADAPARRWEYGVPPEPLHPGSVYHSR